MFQAFALNTPSEHCKLSNLIYEKWSEPRGDGMHPRGRKHQVDAILFAVIGSLRTGMTDLAMEGLCGIPASLLCIEFERTLRILDEVLDELFLMNDEEKMQCRGAAKSYPGLLYIIDGADFPIRVGRHSHIYRTHKKNVHKQQAVRAQMIIDVFWGYFRGLETEPAGMYNDQAMLQKSEWNKPGVLTNDDEYVGADLGYVSTQHINVLTPYNKEELRQYPDGKGWNKIFNKDRGLIERTFGVFEETMRIFDSPWRRHRHLFPLALRVSMKLMNRYWRLPGNMPPGLARQF